MLALCVVVAAVLNVVDAAFVALDVVLVVNVAAFQTVVAVVYVP